jgi:hypothetical protein
LHYSRLGQQLFLHRNILSIQRKAQSIPTQAVEKQVSTGDISAGIKQNIDAESKKGSDGRFHVEYEGQDLALDLIRVHDD